MGIQGQNEVSYTNCSLHPKSKASHGSLSTLSERPETINISGHEYSKIFRCYSYKKQSSMNKLGHDLQPVIYITTTTPRSTVKLPCTYQMGQIYSYRQLPSNSQCTIKLQIASIKGSYLCSHNFNWKERISMGLEMKSWAKAVNEQSDWYKSVSCNSYSTCRYHEGWVCWLVWGVLGRCGFMS